MLFSTHLGAALEWLLLSAGLLAVFALVSSGSAAGLGEILGPARKSHNSSACAGDRRGLVAPVADAPRSTPAAPLTQASTAFAESAARLRQIRALRAQAAGEPGIPHRAPIPEPSFADRPVAAVNSTAHKRDGRDLHGAAAGEVALH